MTLEQTIKEAQKLAMNRVYIPKSFRNIMQLINIDGEIKVVRIKNDK